MKREQDCAAGLSANEIAPMYFVPSLREICARTIAENFETLPNADKLRELDQDLYNLVVDQLPTNLKLEVTVPRISSDDYWKSCCESRWSSGQLSAYTGTGSLTPPTPGGWKRVYLQRHLAEKLMSLETAEPREEDLEQLEKLRALCGAELHTLNLTHQRCHFDVFELVSKLPRLQDLRITYNVLNAAVSFKQEMIGMKQNDALSLQRLLKTYAPLTTLHLTGNRIDSLLLKAILVGMVRNNTLQHLDLSHNLIDDDGISALSVILMKKDSALLTVNLSNNSIRAEGAKLLGKALGTDSCKITKLSLRMNRIGDSGGERFFHFFKQNTSVRELDVACNELGPESAEALSNCLQGGNTTLQVIDISCNRLDSEGGRLLLLGLQASPNLHSLDVRQSGLNAADVVSINEITYDRTQALKMQATAAIEAQLAKEREWYVSDRIRRTHGDLQQ